MFQISLRHYVCETEAIRAMNNIRRKFGGMISDPACNELGKQTLNCVASHFLASYAEQEGIEIDWTAFPKLACYRSLAKVYFYKDTPEYIMKALGAKGNIEKGAFDRAIKEKIAENFGSEFANFISEPLGTYEERIFKAARRITTFVELHENQFRISQDTYCTKVQEILAGLESLHDIPGVRELTDIHGPMFKLLLEIAGLRNQNRWTEFSYSTECSVLGHLFDTAMLAYFMSLEMNPEDEKTATERFFIGIFHDVAEAWTTDIPSTIKKMKFRNAKTQEEKALRDLIEAYEREMLEKHVYSQVPDFLEKKLRKIGYEEEENVEVKPLIKGADYLSGDSECYRQYVAGCNDIYFLDAMVREEENIATGLVIIPPVAQQLYWKMRRYCEVVTAQIPRM